MSAWEQRLGFHPSELVDPSDLPTGNPIKYQRDAEERAERFMEMISDLQSENEAIRKELAELRETVNSLVARPHEIKVVAAPPQIVVHPSEVKVEAPQVTVSPSIEMPDYHVVHAPEKPAKTRIGEMVKQKDGSFKFTIEEQEGK